PCKTLWSEAPMWLERYPNVVIVDVDVSKAQADDKDMTGPEVQVLHEIGVFGTLPIAIQIGPFGQLMRAETGLERIRVMLYELDRRSHLHVLPFGTPASGLGCGG